MRNPVEGRLIVLEGSDGSGKATQSRALVRRLRAEKIPAVRLAFPQYERSFFGRRVAEYLRGEMGSRVDPHLAALLYAADRLEAKPLMERRLAEGKVIICDRYVDSNKAHQGARVRDARGRREFLKWVDRLEYGLLGLPRPDYTVFLHVPPAVAAGLIARKGRRAYLRGRRRDIHEADSRHLRSAEKIFLQLASDRPQRSGALIECIENGRLLSRSEIAERVWRSIQRSGLLRVHK